MNGNARGRYHFYQKYGDVPGVGVPDIGYVTTFLKNMPTYPHSNSTWGILPFYGNQQFTGNSGCTPCKPGGGGGERGGPAHAESFIFGFVSGIVLSLFLFC